MSEAVQHRPQLTSRFTTFITRTRTGLELVTDQEQPSWLLLGGGGSSDLSGVFCSCCGAGVAADAVITSQILASNVELHMLNTGQPPLVAMVTRQLKQMLFRYVGEMEGAKHEWSGLELTGAVF